MEAWLQFPKDASSFFLSRPRETREERGQDRDSTIQYVMAKLNVHAGCCGVAAEDASTMGHDANNALGRRTWNLGQTPTSTDSVQILCPSPRV